MHFKDDIFQLIQFLYNNYYYNCIVCIIYCLYAFLFVYTVTSGSHGRDNSGNELKWCFSFQKFSFTNVLGLVYIKNATVLYKHHNIFLQSQQKNNTSYSYPVSIYLALPRESVQKLTGHLHPSESSEQLLTLNTVRLQPAQKSQLQPDRDRADQSPAYQP